MFWRPLRASSVARAAVRQTDLDFISAVTTNFCPPQINHCGFTNVQYKAKEPELQPCQRHVYISSNPTRSFVLKNIVFHAEQNITLTLD